MIKKHQVNLNVAIISVKFKNEELFPDISSSVRVMKKDLWTGLCQYKQEKHYSKS